MLGAELKRRLWLIFGLGALQGAVGWWMVASGLTQRVEVSQYRLATHLVLALLIFAAIVWTVRRLTERPQPARQRAAEDHQRRSCWRWSSCSSISARWSRACARAGSTTPGPRSTAPSFHPPHGCSSKTPWWRNLFDNTLTVQFEHRMTAYALLVLALLHAVDAVARARRKRAVVRGAWWLVAAIIAAGDARHPHAAQSGADRSRADASGGRDRGADACDFPDRTADGAPRANRPREDGSAGRAARLN